jgi:hypothetical protein
MTSPSWPELIILMCFGETEEMPFTGVVEVDEALVGDGGDDWEDEHAALLPTTVRVHKDGSRYRVEDLDGTVLYIRGADRSWQFRPGADMPAMVDYADDEEVGHGSYAHAVERPNPTRWRGNDFTTPTGPVTATTWLGRDAWEVEIAPPPHKSGNVSMVVDAVTGMQLSWRHEEHGDVFRWTHIEHGVDLDDSMFTWDGPFMFAHGGAGEDLPDDVLESIDRSEVEKAGRLADLGVSALAVTLSSPPEAWTVGDDGSFHAGYDFDAYVGVCRRPRSGDTWDLDGDDDTWVRWTDGDWDWAARVSCRGDSTTDDQVLEQIRQQLAEARPDGH